MTNNAHSIYNTLQRWSLGVRLSHRTDVLVEVLHPLLDNICLSLFLLLDLLDLSLEIFDLFLGIKELAFDVLSFSLGCIEVESQLFDLHL